VEFTAQGKDGTIFFNSAEAIASVYAREFQKGGLLNLIKRFRLYDIETSKLAVKGQRLVDEGALLYKKALKEEAIYKWMEALKIFEKTIDARGMAMVFHNLGIVNKDFYLKEKAIEYFTASLRLYRLIGDFYSEAKLLSDIGFNYSGLGQSEKALKYLSEAIEIDRILKNEASEGEDVLKLGIVYMNLGQYFEALLHYTDALRIFRDIGDPAKEAMALNNVGIIFNNRGQYREAIKYYNEALQIFRSLRDVHLQMKVFNQIGVALFSLGRYDEALDYYRKGLVRGRSLGDPILEAGFLNNIALVYYDLGLNTKALDNFNGALRLHRIHKDDKLKLEVLMNIGNVHYRKNKYKDALDNYTSALALSRRLNDAASEAKVVGNMGNVYSDVGEYEEALKYYTNSLKVNQSIGYTAGTLIDLMNIGIVNYKLGRYGESIEQLKASVKMLASVKAVENRWRAYSALGRSLRKSGNSEEAIVSYKSAIEAIEEIYSHTKGLQEDDRSSIIGHKGYVYEEFIDLLLELHRQSPDEGYDKEAFTISEKGKSRVFQELMVKAGARVSFGGDRKFKEMIEKETRLRARGGNLRQMIRQENSKPEKERNRDVIKAVKQQLLNAEISLREQEKEIEVKYPRYADLSKPKPLSVQELQEILKPDETILAYTTGIDNIAAFVIGKESFKLTEIGIRKEELEGLIRNFREGLDNVYSLGDLEKFNPDTSYRLYKNIFLPVLKELKGVSRLYISADDLLYTLPFEALVTGGHNSNAFTEARRKAGEGDTDLFGEYKTLRYLLDEYTITYLPSASVLRSLRKYEKSDYGTWKKSLIGFADPVFSSDELETETEEDGKDKGIQQKGISKETELSMEILGRSTGGVKLGRLVETAQEVKAIFAEVGGKGEDIYLRKRASEENIYNISLKDARYLLFSTHGLLGGDFSGVAEPALALTLLNNPPGRDGFLSMSEVLGLDLNSELVVLSACNTFGRGDKAGRGEGFAGLTRSFMYAGARSLLVTHWSVESQAAKELMVETFKNMKNKSRPEALRQAKLVMKDSSRPMRGNSGRKLSLSHPFFWAAFVLVGESE